MAVPTSQLLFLCLLAYFCGTESSRTLSQKRITTIQRRTENIGRQLIGIEHKEYFCNGSLQEVIAGMDGVAKQVDDLYKGPYVANMDLSSGSDKYAKVLMKLQNPVEQCLERYRGTQVGRRNAEITCIQQMIWKEQAPVRPNNGNAAGTTTGTKEDRLRLNERFAAKQKEKDMKHTTSVNTTANEVDNVQYPLKKSTFKQIASKYPPIGMMGVGLSSSTPFSSSPFSTPTSTPVDTRRVRKEYRTLTLAERTRFHNALNVLHENGTIDEYAQDHRRASRGAHRGPAFLPWHRVFIKRFEDKLREVDPSVTLPYWDSTLENRMENPLKSIMWSSDFVGNGAGVVVTGPFAYWTTDGWFLEREYGARGRLVNDRNIDRVMTRCNYSEITVPTGTARIEGFHNNVHLYVGGDMRSVRTAPYDPVFYMHHCYIDYVWEKWRFRQSEICGNDPETDYLYNNSIVIFRQRYNTRMAQQTDYRVREGLENYWTEDIYRYEDTPTCENNCGGSAVLYCDQSLDACVPMVRDPDPTTTTTVQPSTTLFARKRRAADSKQAVESEKAKISVKYQKPGAKTKPKEVCDKYIDPGCKYKTLKRLNSQKKYIAIEEEVKLIDDLVPKHRGEDFGPEEVDEEEEPKTIYRMERQAMRRQLQAVRNQAKRKAAKKHSV